MMRKRFLRQGLIAIAIVLFAVTSVTALLKNARSRAPKRSDVSKRSSTTSRSRGRTTGATRLLNLARLRLHPEEKIHELAETIVKKECNEDFKQAVWDYTVLLDKFVGDGEQVKSQSFLGAVSLVPVSANQCEILRRRVRAYRSSISEPGVRHPGAESDPQPGIDDRNRAGK
jgi:hypothetical protein